MNPRENVIPAITEAKSRWAKASSIHEIRQGFEELLQAPKVEGADYFIIAEIPAVWVGSEAPDLDDGVILYCHGGGFQIGSIHSHMDLMERLSVASGMSVLGFDYRLAPEHRFPAAHEDALKVYQWLLEQGYASRRIAIAGDSAGASLVLGVAAAHLQKSIAPACLALISPWLDTKLTGDSYVSRVDQDIFSEPDQLRLMAKTYIGREGDPEHALLNPMSQDWNGAPPSLVHVGDDDITRDDGLVWAQNAQKRGVSVTTKIWPEMFHHFQVFGQLPEAEASIAEIAGFIQRHIAQPLS